MQHMKHDLSYTMNNVIGVINWKSQFQFWFVHVIIYDHVVDYKGTSCSEKVSFGTEFP